MKKIILPLILTSLLALPVKAQTTPSITTTYQFVNISSANLAATMTTASTETPANGATLSSLSSFKNPHTGTFSVTALYR